MRKKGYLIITILIIFSVINITWIDAAEISIINGRIVRKKQSGQQKKLLERIESKSQEIEKDFSTLETSLMGIFKVKSRRQ